MIAATCADATTWADVTMVFAIFVGFALIFGGLGLLCWACSR